MFLEKATKNLDLLAPDAVPQNPFVLMQQSIGSIRRVRIFGDNYKDKIDFEWPNLIDFGQTRKLTALKLVAISWKTSKHASALGAIQLHFLDGTESPLLLATG